MAGVATSRQEEALAANSLPNLFIVVACYLTARRPPCSKVFPGGLDRSSWWPSCATAAPPPPCDRQCPRCRRQSRRQRQHRRQQQQQHQQQWQRYKMTSDDVLQPSATTAAVAKMSHRRPLPRARPSSPLHPRGGLASTRSPPAVDSVSQGAAAEGGPARGPASRTRWSERGDFQSRFGRTCVCRKCVSLAAQEYSRSVLIAAAERLTKKRGVIIICVCSAQSFGFGSSNKASSLEWTPEPDRAGGMATAIPAIFPVQPRGGIGHARPDRGRDRDQGRGSGSPAGRDWGAGSSRAYFSRRGEHGVEA